MDYRREIDGLRALAVVPVILFHAGFETFRGGFVGVDVFFVISGYLITTIILAELEQGNFSIVNFYERRARRILPTLFFVMFACIPFSWILLSPADLTSFSKSLIAVPLFLSNFFFWRDGGYFETAAELKPLLHTWSLAVEEQYYVIFPLFLLLSWKLGKHWILLTLGVIFFASLVLAQWASHAMPDVAFYLLPTRVWELLVGAGAAFYLSRRGKKIFGENLSEIAGWTGVMLILFSVFSYDNSTPFPGIFALIPTLGTLLIILFASQQTYVGKFVGNKIFVGIGLISYSAYLWHQPVLAYARHWIVDFDHFLALLLIALVLILSILSWKYVELPFRNKEKFGRTFIFTASSTAALFFISLGYISSNIDFNKEELMAKILSENEAIYSSNINERKFIKNRIENERLDPEAIVIGSSRIMQASSKGTGIDLLNLSVSGAKLEDLLAIWELSSDKFDPSYVFLGADPWIFNVNSEETRWNYLSKEYGIALARLGIKKEIAVLPAKRPLPFNSVAVRIYDSINQSKTRAEDDTPSVSDKIRKDGSRVYNLSYANKSPSEVAREAQGYISYAMEDFAYSSEVSNIFERFIIKIEKQNRDVFLVLSPYHPKLFELMRLNDVKFLEIETEFRKIAERSGAKVIGSYDPSKVGCSSEDFYDGMHPKDRCIDKIFSQLKSGVEGE